VAGVVGVVGVVMLEVALHPTIVRLSANDKNDKKVPKKVSQNEEMPRIAPHIARID
jgi:hypothetical protein